MAMKPVEICDLVITHKAFLAHMVQTDGETPNAYRKEYAFLLIATEDYSIHTIPSLSDATGIARPNLAQYLKQMSEARIFERADLEDDGRMKRMIRGSEGTRRLKNMSRMWTWAADNTHERKNKLILTRKRYLQRWVQTDGEVPTAFRQELAFLLVATAAKGEVYTVPDLSEQTGIAKPNLYSFINKMKDDGVFAQTDSRVICGDGAMDHLERYASIWSYAEEHADEVLQEEMAA